MASEYLNNKDFYVALVEYNRTKDQHKQIPNNIGIYIKLLSENLASKPNFSGYPFKEDMIGDGILNCLTYLDRFDTDKYNNPFAYFTTIIFYAFIRKIKKEKSQLVLKHKILLETYINGGLADNVDEAEGVEIKHTLMDNLYLNNLINELDSDDVPFEVYKKKTNSHKKRKTQNNE